MAFVVVRPEHRNEAVKRELHDFVNTSVAYYKRLSGGIVWVDDSKYWRLNLASGTDILLSRLFYNSPQEPQRQNPAQVASDFAAYQTS